MGLQCESWRINLPLDSSPSSTGGNLAEFYPGYSSHFICSFQRTSRSARSALGIKSNLSDTP
jgi:hypothetical protein